MDNVTAVLKSAGTGWERVVYCQCDGRPHFCQSAPPTKAEWSDSARVARPPHLLQGTCSPYRNDPCELTHHQPSISTIFRTGRLEAPSMPVSNSTLPGLPPQPHLGDDVADQQAALWRVHLVRRPEVDPNNALERALARPGTALATKTGIEQGAGGSSTEPKLPPQSRLAAMFTVSATMIVLNKKPIKPCTVANLRSFREVICTSDT